MLETLVLARCIMDRGPPRLRACAFVCVTGVRGRGAGILSRCQGIEMPMPGPLLRTQSCSVGHVHPTPLRFLGRRARCSVEQTSGSARRLVCTRSMGDLTRCCCPRRTRRRAGVSGIFVDATGMSKVRAAAGSLLLAPGNSYETRTKNEKKNVLQRSACSKKLDEKQAKSRQLRGKRQEKTHAHTHTKKETYRRL